MTVAIAGVGETDHSFADPRAPAAMAVDAIRRALADAGLTADDVDGVVTEAGTMAPVAPIDQVSMAAGIRGRRFSAAIGLAGSGTVGAPSLARMAIESGQADVVVAYFTLNLSRRGAGGAYTFHAEDPAKASFEMPFGFYGQPVYFASTAARYRHEFGLDERHLGMLALSSRAMAARTPNALRPTPLSLDDYLAQPMLADPLRKADCCLVNDSAVAYVMTSVERARDLRRPPVVIAGGATTSKAVTQAQYFTQSPDLTSTAATTSGPLALARAGVALDDVDIAEIYDCFTISLLLQIEDLGFAPKGEGGAYVESGATGAHGTCPVNTHGGLLAQSYSVGAGHVVEAVRQLRGERGDGQIDGAEVALVAGLGVPEHATLVLTVDR
jgi:acetyl-CoA acetyltransferase